jgi:two-component system NtrC family sensor kinase
MSSGGIPPVGNPALEGKAREILNSRIQPSHLPMRILETLHGRRAYHYVPAASLLLLSLLLFAFDGTLFACLALLIVAGSLLSTRSLLMEVEKTAAQKKKLDQQLIQSQKLASVGELSSGIAHEINNPLAIIGQEIEWVKHLLGDEGAGQPSNPGELADSCREIAQQVDRCKEITHKLLDFARKSEPLVQSTDMNRLVEDMARLVDREAILKQIKIIRKYQADLPVVQTDGPLLRQVVLNLLTNAAFAIGENGTITVETRDSGEDAVEVLVTDTGCGIQAEDLGKIFDPFFTTKPQGLGTGLGLSICHGIVTRLGGEIHVESEVRKGSVFKVRLPIEAKKGERLE